jgi:hypothetical protein
MVKGSANARELRLGKHEGADMMYAYTFSSVSGDHYYVGSTRDLRNPACKTQCG